MLHEGDETVATVCDLPHVCQNRSLVLNYKLAGGFPLILIVLPDCRWVTNYFWEYFLIITVVPLWLSV